MNGKQLKNSILQWAIQGKLVPQDPNDEPASVLLEKIRAEKARLVKEGKIQLSKPEKAVKDSGEEDFELPTNWTWCLLNDVCRVFGRIGFRGYTKEDLRDKKEDGAISISPSNMVNGRMNYSNCTFISQEKYDESPEIKIYDGDILIVKTGSSYGKASLIKQLPWKSTINPQIAAIKDIKIINEFLLHILQSPYAQSKFNEFVLGTSIPTFSQLNLLSLRIPLPPLAEQHRIVAKIEELMPLVEKYGAAQEALDEWNQALPEKLKKSILQEAIQGKLVPQDPADGIAVISNNPKTPKKISNFDDYLFEIPDNWKWCQLFQIADVIGGYAFQSADLKSNTGVRVIRISDITPQGLSNKSVVRCSLKDVPSQYAIKNNDILIAMTGGTVGKSLLLEYLSEPMYLNQRVAMIRASKEIEIGYLNLIIKSPLIQSIISDVKNSTNDNISMADILGFPVPLPPLAEQRRIVAKIEELFGVIK